MPSPSFAFLAMIRHCLLHADAVYASAISAMPSAACRARVFAAPLFFHAANSRRSDTLIPAQHFLHIILAGIAFAFLLRFFSITLALRQLFSFFEFAAVFLRHTPFSAAEDIIKIYLLSISLIARYSTYFPFLRHADQSRHDAETESCSRRRLLAAIPRLSCRDVVIATKRRYSTL